MKISNLKVDGKGRIQLPSSFLTANGITKGTRGWIESVNNNNYAIRLTFQTRQQIDDNIKKLEEKK
mgnify:CR=1 FL=1|tara:strand:- start:8699 stop:8896 length:198 start_codon:yes stop_codon:yes gene_type:complete